jgi:multisubunit Na+/H+ antiporter MnhC subunit
MKFNRSPDDLERLAQRRASAKMGWFIHLAVYLLVNAGLFILSTQFGMHRWSIFPAAGWGLGVLLHGVSVFVLGSGSGLRERLVERERERLRRQFERDDTPQA